MKRLLAFWVCAWVLVAGSLSAASSEWLKEAQSISEGLDDEIARIMNLTEIASVWAQKGEADKALQLLQAVDATLADFEAADMRIRVLAEMGVVYQKAGASERAEARFKSAQELLTAVEDADERPWLLGWISGCAARAGKIELAQDLSASIVDPSAAAESRGFIALAKAEAGALSEAITLLADIDDPAGRGWALADLLEWVAKQPSVDAELTAQLRQQTLTAAAAIEDPYGQATIEIRVARVDAQSGASDKALAILKESRALVGSIPEYYWQIESYGLLARAYAEAGDRDSARLAMQSAEAVVSGLTVPAARSWNQAEVAVAYAAIGDRETALERAAGIEWLTAQAWAVAEVALAAAKAGDSAAAEELVQRIRVPFWRAKALIQLAELEVN